jgi:hypothetical protein
MRKCTTILTPHKITVTIPTSVRLRKRLITMNTIATLHEIHELFVVSSCHVSFPQPRTVDHAPLTDHVRTRYERYYLMSFVHLLLLLSVATFCPFQTSVLLLLSLGTSNRLSCVLSTPPCVRLLHIFTNATFMCLRSIFTHLFINVSIMSMQCFCLCQYLCLSMPLVISL